MLKRVGIRGKKAIELETLGWIILGILTLVVVIVGYMILNNKGLSALDFIKNLFRFGN
jgi:multisubunit Na+/H+ antiporter MnhB subunit